MDKKKYYYLLKGAIVGGVIGLLIHLVQHFIEGEPLFSISPHILHGTLFTSGGIIAGIVIALILKKE